jgi:hypothetical protein
MRYFTTEDIGPTRKLTPDGFLICLGVPIARTGRMVYSIRDLPTYEPGDDGHTILVDRYPAELFSPQSMASFEGMPLTDDHPPGYMMSPEVFRKHAVGHMQNVRPGTEEGKPDCLLADLFVSDAAMIKKVLAGKVQVSAGYDAQYRKVGAGVYEQHDVVGNHTAFVKAGRCGPRCSVGDKEVDQPCGCADKESCTCPTTAESSFMVNKVALKAAMDNFSKTLDEASETNTEGGTHVHVHMPTGQDMPTVDKRTKDGAGDPDTTGTVVDARTKDQKTKDEEADARLTSMEGRLETLEDMLCESTTDARMVTSMDARMKDAMARMRDRRSRDAKSRDAKSRDADESDEDKKKREEKEAEEAKTKDARMKDGDSTPEDLKDVPAKTTDAATGSAYFEPEFTQAVTLSAILAPGLSMPTFDSQAHFATTAASLCNLRRASLRHALGQASTKDVVAAFADSTATIDRMPCMAVKMAFLGAAEMVRQRNNGTMGAVLGRPITPPAPNKSVRTAAQINEDNQKKWAR